MDYFSGQREEENHIQWDDRCHVIKLLQEQVQNLLCYKNDYDQMEKRAEMAEKLLEMRESESKLKFDEIEETFKALEDENQKLKSQLSKEFQKSLKNNVTYEVDNENNQNTINKWKLKYKALARMTNGSSNSANSQETSVIELQVQVSDLKKEIDEKKEQISTLSEELRKASSEAIQAKEGMAKLLKNVRQLEIENNTIKQEKSKLLELKKQKSALLQHSRSQQEKTNKNLQQFESSTSNEIEVQKKKFLNQSAEITRLSNQLDNETKIRKSAEKKLIKMKKAHDLIAQKLQASLKKLQDENKKIQTEMNEVRLNHKSLSNELNNVNTEKEELKAALIRADKIRKRKENLELTVKEMQNSIEQLQCSISSAESDSSAKAEELKNLMIKHWGGTALNFEWSDCIAMIDEKFSLVQAQETIIQTMKSQVNKMKKKNQKMHNDIMQNIEGSQMQSVSQQSEAFSDDTPVEPQVIFKEAPNPFLQINNFRHSVTKRMNKYYFEMVDEIEKLNGVFIDPKESDNSVDIDMPSMRIVILTTIMARRWIVFKKTDPIDPTSILEYVQNNARHLPSKLSGIISKTQNILLRLKQQSAQNGILSKANHELTQRLQNSEAESRKRQEESFKQTQQKENIQQEVKFYETKISKLIDPNVHESVKVQLQSQIEENKKLEEQVIIMKTEMKNLLDSIDCKHGEVSDFQDNLIELADENEDLKQHIDELNHELSVTQSALKERTRELLAIERKLMKQKQNVVIVKESIPLTPQISKNRMVDDFSNSGNFLTEAIRGGLVQMQSKILRGDEMI